MEKDTVMPKNEEETGLPTALQKAARLFSLYLRIPILASPRKSLPIEEFRRRAVFMEKAQALYQTEYLSKVLSGGQGRQIQVLEDPLGTRAVLLLDKETAVMFGPFVPSPYQEKTCHQILSRFVRCDPGLLLHFKLFWCDLGISDPEDVVRAAQAMAEYAGLSQEDFPVVHIKGPGRASPAERTETADLPPWQADTFQNIEQRYAAETELMDSISRGDEEAAISSLRHIRRTSRPQRGMTVDLWPQESATAIMRSLIRLSAKRSGLSPVIIDGISLDYAQKMRRVGGSHKVLAKLYEDMISSLCREIRLMREEGYSPLTRQALFLIRKHYGEPLSVGSLSRMLQVSESSLSRSLRADTGQTFTGLLKRERMANAARLLASTSESVQAIACRTGIPDQNYFVKVFRSVYHVTPSDYRSLSLFGNTGEMGSS